ncbi:MAG: hypothetical protein RI964_2988 [Pseudomonadota bacterium]|jgi:hypothetical protein
MKKQLLLCSLAILLTACGGKSEQSAQAPADPAKATTQAPSANAESAPAKPAATVDKAALTEEAKAAVQAFSGTLKGELENAMRTGGPIEALKICNTKAPEITKTVSTEKGVQISRVSLKNRNPSNVPNEWQSNVLNQFETRKAAGEDPATLAYAEVVGNEFRFMKAIPTATLCLNCHGTQISPAITAKLGELYPQDKAVGYHEGDLRGAFVVVKNLTQ